MTATARHGKISNRRCALIAMHAKQDLLTASGVNGKICLQLTYAPLCSLFSHTLLVAGQRGTIVHVTPENSTVDISMYCHTIDVFIFLGFKYVIKLPFTFVSNECVFTDSFDANCIRVCFASILVCTYTYIVETHSVVRDLQQDTKWNEDSPRDF